MGETVTIGGIMANASALGDGEDVTAEVRVNGVMIKHSPIKLADVTTGLDITVTAATGLQCEAASAMVKATIKFVEGFASALSDTRFARVGFPRHSRGCDRDAEHDGNGNGTRHDGTDLAPLMLTTGRRFSPTHVDDRRGDERP